MESQSVFIWSKFPVPLKAPATMAASYFPSPVRRRSSTTMASAVSPALFSKQETTISLVSVPPPIHGMKNLGFRPTPELGLLSLLFPLSMALGAFLSVAVVSIPTLIAFGRLGASVKKLSKVASEEVPGTLSSIKLSSMELNELTLQLNNLRHKISGIQTGKERGNKNARSFQKKNPVS